MKGEAIHGEGPNPSKLTALGSLETLATYPLNPFLRIQQCQTRRGKENRRRRVDLVRDGKKNPQNAIFQ